IDITYYSKVFIITDVNAGFLFLKKLTKVIPVGFSFVELDAGEKEKNIENVQKIWKAMHDANLDRKSLVINLGGGVIIDIGGFAASTYMRGVDFINIPTTLLSMVDAGIGGKTGIDFNGIKNLVGIFNQPKAVVIDIDVLSTLPNREFLSGFSEIIKHGLIKDKKYFEKVSVKKPSEFNHAQLTDIVSGSCKIKKEIVQSDEKENGARKLLNFGHTIGHAIEALSLEGLNPLNHGEAISIGMLAEARISNILKMISSEDLEVIKKALTSVGLPVRFENLKIEEILKKMKSDKKNEKGNVKFVLLKGIGEAVYDQQIDQSVIKEALEYVSK
ncbi:MAG: 3-dehydroquinate synthase, partial [Candidatus Levybacteria bacterium]|nr:3-dehydroquinate synthase [Candidatus Levybacteria bacterium]